MIVTILVIVPVVVVVVVVVITIIIYYSILYLLRIEVHYFSLHGSFDLMSRITGLKSLHGLTLSFIFWIFFNFII
jgi:hypothetical protein